MKEETPFDRLLRLAREQIAWGEVPRRPPPVALLSLLLLLRRRR